MVHLSSVSVASWQQTASRWQEVATDIGGSCDGQRQLTAAVAGGGGCPYQVSAGRQKEEAVSANMELDMM